MKEMQINNFDCKVIDPKKKFSPRMLSDTLKKKCSKVTVKVHLEHLLA